MTIRLVLTILLATLGTSLHGPSSLFAEELGLITGQLADSRGQIDYVGEVVVFLCDAKSGYPIDRKTKKPMDISFASLPIANAWHTVALPAARSQGYSWPRNWPPMHCYNGYKR